MNFAVVGASGGVGGTDGSAGGNGTSVGHIWGNITVSPGTYIQYGVGTNGDAGGNGASSSSTTGLGGGNGGTNPLDSSYSGGRGGHALDYGSSGGGGGGGAASILRVHGQTLVAAGGGGGGGDNNCTTAALPASFSASGGSGPANSSRTGGRGWGWDDEKGTTSDGSGAGGGGGGATGGYGGYFTKPCSEWLGESGRAGTNSVGTYSSSEVLSGTQPFGTTQEISITWTYANPTSCSATSSTRYGLYTVETYKSVGACTFTVPASVSSLEMFLVGGGGGGGADGGAGGGGGASVSRTGFAVSPGDTLTLTVGYGGERGYYGINSGQFGESTTVIYGATQIVAGGGAGGITSPQAGRPTTPGGTSTTGFAGGDGGNATASSGQTGTDGSKGSTNFFSGFAVEYGGGGGGGVYSSTTQAGSLGNSGGGNGASLSSGVVTLAKDGTDGTGGGGGGGSAGAITSGGRGGSGIVLIRYSTTSSWQFPTDLSSRLYARYLGTDLQALNPSRGSWMDSSGNTGRSGSLTFTGNTESVTTVAGFGSKGTLLAASGTSATKVRFADLPSAASGGYTLFHVARYSGANQGRIFDSTGSTNWLSGFLDAHVGVAHHETGYLTQYAADASSSTGHNNWLLSSDQLNRYRANGVGQNQDYWTAQTVSVGFGINQNPWSQLSDWQVVDAIVFQGELNLYDIRRVENYLATIYALEISAQTSLVETDTALNLNGNNGAYLRAYADASHALSDTFTVESWIKPGSACIDGTRECFIFNREPTLITRIYSGTLQYGMYDCGSSLVWIDTEVKFKSGEWQHLAIVKDGIANTNGSLKIYRNGQLAYTKPGSPYYTSTADVTLDNTKTVCQRSNLDYDYLFIGIRLGGTYGFSGLIDEVKVWKKFKTASEIRDDMHRNPTTAELTGGFLQLYYDFNKNSYESKVENRAGNTSRTDLRIIGTSTFDDVKSLSTVSGIATVTFPRSYINAFGGWKAPTDVSKVDFVVVGGGGGGGGGYQGGGGGAGAFIESSTTVTPGLYYPITVGTGGRGFTNRNTRSGLYEALAPTSGETSSAFSITSIGGGSGAGEYIANATTNTQFLATSGGSGGGGSWGDPSTQLAGGGISGQGYAGGIGGQVLASSSLYGGGGGGAGGAGVAFADQKPGNGGAGAYSQVLARYLAAGGAGSMRNNASNIGIGAIGGSSIGGNSAYSAVEATNGSPNTGSGGGAGSSYWGTSGFSGLGGSGVVAFRYSILKPQAKLYIGQYNAYPNISTYPLNVYGGSGSGTVTRSLEGPGSAGCTLTNGMFIQATNVGSCNVSAVKAADTTYLAETATATIYWIQWSDIYATRVQSTPNEIVLQHQTQIIKYTYDTLTAVSFADVYGNAITSAYVDQVIRLIGTGFVSTDASTTILLTNGENVWFDDLVINTSVASANYIQFRIPSGVSSGVVGVSTSKGTAYTSSSLTVSIL